MDIHEKLRLHSIPRWTMVNVSRPQNVAEHTYGVTIIALEIAKKLRMYEREEEILWLAIHHDMLEVLTGDVPSPTKMRVSDAWIEMEKTLDPEMYRISKGGAPEIRAVVKLADFIESMWYLDLYGVGSYPKKVIGWLETKFDAALQKYAADNQGYEWYLIRDLMADIRNMA